MENWAQKVNKMHKIWSLTYLRDFIKGKWDKIHKKQERILLNDFAKGSKGKIKYQESTIFSMLKKFCTQNLDKNLFS